MLSRIMPREEKFFVHFQSQSTLLVEGAKVLKELFTDIKRADFHSSRVREAEQKADQVTHKIIGLLHETFITPMDREDIHLLATKLDDIMDFMDATAQRMLLYDVKYSPPSALELADILLKAVERIHEVMMLLADMKNHEAILRACVEINRLENESDHVFRVGTGKLFREEPDTRELIKSKEIYEIMEATLDRCEEVAHLIEGIVLEYA